MLLFVVIGWAIATGHWAVAALLITHWLCTD